MLTLCVILSVAAACQAVPIVGEQPSTRLSLFSSLRPLIRQAGEQLGPRTRHEVKISEKFTDRSGMSEVTAVVKDVIFRSDCTCVEPAFCTATDIDRYSDKRCDEGYVCCYSAAASDFADGETATADSGKLGMRGGDRNDIHVHKVAQRHTSSTSPAPATASPDKDDLFPELDTAGFVDPSDSKPKDKRQGGTHAGHTEVLVTAASGGFVKKEPVCSCSCDNTAAAAAASSAIPLQNEVTHADNDDDDEGVSISEAEVVLRPPVSLPTTDQCGVDRRHLIIDNKQSGVNIGGRGIAGFAEFPWTLLILQKSEVNAKANAMLCGAALIHPMYALTAAHCVRGKDSRLLRVRAGEYDTQHEDETLPHMDVDVADITLHPKFSALNLTNDLALLRLTVRIDTKYNYHINKICLAKNSDGAATSCYVTGWGAKHGPGGQLLSSGGPMKKMPVKLLRRAECEQQLQETELGPNYQLVENSICAKAKEKDNDSALGDGGGPMFCKTRNADAWKLVGIVSWGKASFPDAPGVYAAVRPAADWINQVFGL